MSHRRVEEHPITIRGALIVLAGLVVVVYLLSSYA